MSVRIGVVQSTSSVPFFGMEIMGDWNAMVGGSVPSLSMFIYYYGRQQTRTFTKKKYERDVERKEGRTKGAWVRRRFGVCALDVGADTVG